jgi:hypothetical protein
MSAGAFFTDAELAEWEALEQSHTELLETLEWIETECSEWLEDAVGPTYHQLSLITGLRNKARAAIARAKGEYGNTCGLADLSDRA